MDDFVVAIAIVAALVLFAPGRRNAPPSSKYLRHREIWEDVRDDDNDRG